MASSKKRKADQDDEQLSLLNRDAESKPRHLAVAYIRQPDDDSGSSDPHGGSPLSDSDPEYEEEEEDVRKLLAPLDTDQLSSLLVSAAERDPATLAEIRALTDLDPAHRKLFVHSLGWESTSDSLRAVFARYGELEECRVVTDRVTGRSKGYGFVLFRQRSSARRALRNPQKLIDNRMATCQLASTGPSQNANHHPRTNHNPNPNPGDNLPRKIYVGNLHGDVDPRRLHAFFSQYGEIEEGPIGFDRNTGKAKGFALFVFRSVDGARKALEEPNKNFEGCNLVCQKATDSNKSRVLGPGPNNANGLTAAQPNATVGIGGFSGPVYGAQFTAADMGLAQQAAMFGQGLIGQGLPMNTALLAMLAAAGQNPAAFSINPAMLASLNPALVGALSAGVSSTAGPQAAMAQQHGVVPNYAMGNSGYQNAGFQAPPGFQGPPGYQGSPGFQGTTPPGTQQAGGGSAGSYQGANLAQAALQRTNMGSMGGYGSH